jgi:hypothetical protein
VIFDSSYLVSKRSSKKLPCPFYIVGSYLRCCTPNGAQVQQ